VEEKGLRGQDGRKRRDGGERGREYNGSRNNEKERREKGKRNGMEKWGKGGQRGARG